GILAEDPDEAETWFARARSAHQDQPMPFEQARTLLCEGEALRRARRPAASRRPLYRALTVFNGLGAEPWAARAMTELAAAGGRAAVSLAGAACRSRPGGGASSSPAGPSRLPVLGSDLAGTTLRAMGTAASSERVTSSTRTSAWYALTSTGPGNTSVHRSLKT